MKFCMSSVSMREGWKARGMKKLYEAYNVVALRLEGCYLFHRNDVF